MIWRYLEEQKVSEQTLVQAFPVKRMGRPEELVVAARYLGSDEARFCTGTTPVLDGASPPSNGPCSAEFARARLRLTVVAAVQRPGARDQTDEDAERREGKQGKNTRIRSGDARGTEHARLLERGRLGTVRGPG